RGTVAISIQNFSHTKYLVHQDTCCKRCLWCKAGSDIREDPLGWPLQRDIDGRRGRRRIEVDLHRECTTPPRLVDETGSRMDDRGSADGEKDVARAGVERRIEIGRIQRLAEPDDRGPRHTVASRTPRRTRGQ